MDAVIIGSGPNGLAAAIYLQEKGLSTAVFEKAHEVGGATRSAELTLPGYMHDLGSSIHPLAKSSPFFKTLPLSQYGLEWVDPEIPYAHPFLDGSAIGAFPDIDTTSQQLGRDQHNYFQLMTWLKDNWEDLEQEILKPMRIPRSPLKMAQFGKNALLSAKLFNQIHFKEEKTRAFFYGAAAHATLPLTSMATASFGMVLNATAHKYGWPFPRGGASSIPESLAAYYKSIGGKVFLNTEVTHIDQLPTAKAYLFDLTPRQLLNIKGTKFSQKYRLKMASYRYGQGIFKVDWALKEPIPFTNPICRKAGTVHLGYSTKEMEASAAHGHKGYLSHRPYVLLAQHTVFDSTRAPKGMHTAWAYCHVPNGSTADMTPHIEAQIERAAPGFKDLIVGKHTQNTVQLEAWNPNLVGGDINGGKQDIMQMFTRPVARLSPYSTPDKRVYICSASTPPGGGVHGMCGYNAALKVFADHFG